MCHRNPTQCNTHFWLCRKFIRVGFKSKCHEISPKCALVYNDFEKKEKDGMLSRMYKWAFYSIQNKMNEWAHLTWRWKKNINGFRLHFNSYFANVCFFFFYRIHIHNSNGVLLQNKKENKKKKKQMREKKESILFLNNFFKLTRRMWAKCIIEKFRRNEMRIIFVWKSLEMGICVWGTKGSWKNLRFMKRVEIKSRNTNNKIHEKRVCLCFLLLLCHLLLARVLL